MTKEEIAERASNTWVWVINSNSSDLPTLQDIIEEAMQEYADLQNKELIAKLEELENEVLKHAEIGFKIQSELNAVNSKHVTEITSRNKRINDLEARLAEKDKEVNSYHNNYIKQLEYANSLQVQLTELKEKHKRDVNNLLETLHFHGYIDHDITKLKDLTEQYYNETHKTK